MEGQIRKMITENANPVRYFLDLKEDFLDVNSLIGRTIKIFYDHNECLGCGLDVPLYRMGYCKNCFFTLPQANESIIRPELSTAHLGIEQRDLEWEKKFELVPHFVYLADTSDIKVGVTRQTQIPTRWIDQGATSAVIFAQTENRYQAGIIEVALKEHIADKTNYRKMLRNVPSKKSLLETKEEMKKFLPEEQAHFYIPDSKIYSG